MKDDFAAVGPPAGRPAGVMAEAWHAAWFGAATVSPDGPVVAGSLGSWTLTYTVGRYGLDDGATLVIAWRDMSDWGKPQFDRPSEPNHCTVTTTGPARLRARYNRKAFRRPWRQGLVVDVSEDSLWPGDTVTIVFGDRSGGSPGQQAQTFREETFEFKVCVDCHGANRFAECPVNPELAIVAGPPAVLRLVCPSQAVVGQPSWVGVRVEDGWGNPTDQYTGSVRLHAAGLAGLPDHVKFQPLDGGAKRVAAIAVTPGPVRVTGEDRPNRLAAESNPLVVAEMADRWQPLWGDLHGQSEETVGTNTLEAYFRFGRDKAFCDFLGHQGNDFQITAETWRRLQVVADGLEEPGLFLPLLGYEWSGPTPAGGDRNVYFPDAVGELRRSSHWLVPDESDLERDAPTVEDLFAAFAGRDVLIVAHVGGRYADLRWHDDDLERLIEVHSAWGRFDWLREEALGRGYVVGFTAGSDGHKGRPGASHPGSSTFGVYGGLTCALATEHTRRGLWQALRARRTYGTSGARIAVRCEIGGLPPGAVSAWDRSPVPFTVEVAGTAPIESIELFRGLDLVAATPAVMPRLTGQRLRLSWGGARVKARQRLQDWTGEVQVAGAVVTGAWPWAFDSPAEGLTAVESDRVAWVSWTAGDEDGVILELGDLSAEVILHVRAGGFDPILTVGPEPVTVPLGGLDLRVTAEWEPLGLRAADATWHGEVPPPGDERAAYWLRIRQTDGHLAWTSPVYLSPGEQDMTRS